MCRTRRRWPCRTACCQASRNSLTVAPQKRTVISTGYLLTPRFALRGLSVRYPAAFVMLCPIHSPKDYSIGQLLIAARIANGMSQRELADRLGVSETQVSRDERNED